MDEKIRILYIDDFELDRELVKDALEKEHGGFELTEASNKQEFEELLTNHDFDVVLSDFNIAGFEGLRVVDIVRAYDDRIPVIIVTGTGSEEIAVKALRHGASDYVIKRPKHILRLPQTIFAVLEKQTLRNQHKQAEERLIKQHAMLARTENIAHIGSWEWEISTDTVTWSEELFRIFNLDPDDGAPSWAEHPKLYNPEDFEALRQVVETAVKEGTPYEIELRAFRKDGETRICQARGFAEFGEKGKPDRLFGSLHDITELRHGEKELRESREQFKSAFENSRVGIALVSLDGKFLKVNRAVTRILGYSEQEMSVKSFAEITHPGDREISHAKYKAYLDGECDHYEVEKRYIHKDGHTVWGILNISGVEDNDGKLLYSVAQLQDITDRVTATEDKELTLSRYKQKAIEMEALFNGTRILLEEDDFESTARRIFDICRKLTGAKSGYVALLSDDGAENEVLFLESGGLPCDVNPELPMPIRGLRGEAYKFGKAVFDNDFSNSKWMKYMPKGHVHLRNVLFGPLKDSAKTVGLIGLANKDGDFDENDAKIVTAFGELAAIALKQSTIQEALQESEKRYRQTQKLEAIGNLAGGIAHDFNNILSSIIGFTELSLDDVKKGSALEDNLNEVYIAGKRAKDLVKQILTFARQIDTEFKPLQVGKVAKEALKLLRSTIPSDIEISDNIQSDSLVLGDATQIHQLFMNLCTNAAQAMEANGGKIDVELSDTYLDSKFTNKYKGINPGNFLEIKISDTGEGISPEHIEHVFDPYFTTKEVEKGTGMGLSTVHGIVKAYDGEIAVESRVGEGTTFTIYLPVTKKRDNTEKYQSKPLPSGIERILIVDDEPPIAKMASQILKRLGYVTTARTSSLDALELFKKRPNDLDLVITDMTMPNMTGDKLAMELIKIRPDIPIILSTGYSSRMSEDKAKEMGIKAFAMKPLAKENLAVTVRKVLDATKE